MQGIVLTGLGKHYGSGHFYRSLALLSTFPVKKKPLLYVVSDLKQKPPRAIAQIDQLFQTESEAIRSALQKTPAFIVCDLRELTKKSKLLFLGSPTPFMSLDTLGHETKWVDYLVNPIPSLSERGFANLQDTSFLPPPPTVKEIKKTFGVIFFGYKDKKRLTEKTLIDILEKKRFTERRENEMLSWQVFIGLGNDSEYRKRLQHITALHANKEGNIELLPQGELFHAYLKGAQIFIGHFGLSSLTAIAWGIPTLFRSPTKHHLDLVAKHFPQLAYERYPKAMVFLEWQAITEQYRKRFKLGHRFKDWPKLLTALSRANHRRHCLSCKSKKISIVYRKPTQNILRCHHCHLHQVENAIDPALYPLEKSIRYSQDYFLAEYKKSYGRTYEEDRTSIYALADKRLKVIEKIKKQGKLLDIGAALGFFLDRAKLRSYETYGVEISSYAAKKIHRDHHVFRKDILDLNIEEKYEVITLWYVVEHFPDFHLLFKKISSLQKKGDLLAMATPNLNGLTGRYSFNQFCQTSPADHYFLYTAKSLEKCLSTYGYQIIKTIQTGIHYPRFCSRFPLLAKGVNEKTYNVVANLLGLGDTFEIYLKKVRDGST